MLDCRYHGMCQLLSYDGNCTYVCPETGRCQICELMPDVVALDNLAQEIDSMERVRFNNEVRVSDELLVSIARRIREALGVSK